MINFVKTLEILIFLFCIQNKKILIQIKNKFTYFSHTSNFLQLIYHLLFILVHQYSVWPDEIKTAIYWKIFPKFYNNSVNPILGIYQLTVTLYAFIKVHFFVGLTHSVRASSIYHAFNNFHVKDDCNCRTQQFRCKTLYTQTTSK